MAENVKIIEGQITFIDLAAHKITVKDIKGESHTFVWAPPFNDKMGKLKQWFFIKVTGELQEDVGIWKLTDQGYFKRPDDWPAQQRPVPPSRGYPPRDNKSIVYQSTLKVIADVWIHTHPNIDYTIDVGNEAFKKCITNILDETKRVAKEIITESGAQ